MPELTVAASAVAQAIGRRRGELRFTTERQLSDALQALLEDEGYDIGREVRIGPCDRLDFLVGGVAIEVKTQGTAMALERQITRYAGHDEITAVLVVTSRARHRGLPQQINGKPVFVVFLSGWLS